MGVEARGEEDRAEIRPAAAQRHHPMLRMPRREARHHDHVMSLEAGADRLDIEPDEIGIARLALGLQHPSIRAEGAGPTASPSHSTLQVAKKSVRKRMGT